MVTKDLPSSQYKTTRALIIGSGIAGLFAARVLSDYYDQVQLVERDTLPENPECRAGTPQAFQLHRLMLRGKIAVEHLFPGIISELIARGAVSTEGKSIQVAARFGQFDEGYRGLDAQCTRPLFEWTIRQRVQALPNVHFSTALEVINLQMDSEQTHITGVHVRARNHMQQTAILDADLVVDASGSFSKITSWLQHLGYNVPEPERIKTALGYSTRYYKISPQLAKKSLGITTIGRAEQAIKTSYALQIENNQWFVLLFGAGGNYPATSDEEYDRQLQQLSNPKLLDTLLKEATPITSPRGYRISECKRQHFEQMENWPAGLLVIGDAICNLDPIYGHGMTLAALEAEILARCLQEQQSTPQVGFEYHVLKRMQDAIEPAWWIDSIADLRWQGVEYQGKTPPKAVALLQRYIDLYSQVSAKRVIETMSRAGMQPAPRPDLFSSEPSTPAFILMNYLVLSPKVVFNATIYRLLLESEDAQEGPHQLQDLTKEYKLPLDEILNEIIPHFALSFMDPLSLGQLV